MAAALILAALSGVLLSGPPQDHDLIMVGVPHPPSVPEPPERSERQELKPTDLPYLKPEDLSDAVPGARRSSSDLPPVPERNAADKIGVPDATNSDVTSTARQAQNIVHTEMDISRELSQLEDGKVRLNIKVRTERAISEFDGVIELGNNASPSQVLVTVLLYADSENQVQAAQDDASDADKEILQAIQGKFAKARIPFWTALASLGKVKQWSASLEISAGLFAVKGTGGISVTFGK